ncbi:MAG TPA: hypothetical protein VFY99_04820 [Solirubrobacterales bacterium]
MAEQPDNDPTVDREAAAAAAEAGAVGGPGADEDLPPAERAAAEHGGGEAEGFEQAERELIEHASHGDPAPDPQTLASDEAAHPEAEYGSADHEHSSARRDEDVER